MKYGVSLRWAAKFACAVSLFNRCSANRGLKVILLGSISAICAGVRGMTSSWGAGSRRPSSSGTESRSMVPGAGAGAGTGVLVSCHPVVGGGDLARPPVGLLKPTGGVVGIKA